MKELTIGKMNVINDGKYAIIIEKEYKGIRISVLDNDNLHISVFFNKYELDGKYLLLYKNNEIISSVSFSKDLMDIIMDKLNKIKKYKKGGD